MSMRKMAWVTAADTLEVRQSELPQLGATDVLIKTAYSAICGSDLHLYHDRHPFVKAPCTLGHELSGTVLAVGAEVSGVSIGEKVVPEPILTCGTCDHCLHGQYHMCQNVSYGYRKGQAGFGDYYICDQRWIHKVPAQVSLKNAALVEPLSVAIHGVEKAGDVFGKDVVVIGAGAIGALAAAVCHTKGAGRIFIVDTNDYRLNIACNGVGEAVLSSKDCDPVAYVREQTGGRGAHVVIECTGVEICIKQALQMTAKLGTLVQVGICSRPLNDYNYASILSNEITIRGAQGYCFNFEQAIAMLSNGFDLTPYITGEYPLAQISEAFALMATPGVAQMKVLISYDG